VIRHGTHALLRPIQFIGGPQIVTGYLSDGVAISPAGVDLASTATLVKIKLDQSARCGSFHVACGSTVLGTNERKWVKAYIKENPKERMTLSGDLMFDGLVDDLFRSFNDIVKSASHPTRHTTNTHRECRQPA